MGGMAPLAPPLDLPLIKVSKCGNFVSFSTKSHFAEGLCGVHYAIIFELKMFSFASLRMIQLELE